MAIQFSTECAFPDNLTAAAFALEQELGDRIAAGLKLLEDAEKQILDPEADATTFGGQAGIDLLADLGIGNDILDQLFQLKDSESQIAQEAVAASQPDGITSTVGSLSGTTEGAESHGSVTTTVSGTGTGDSGGTEEPFSAEAFAEATVTENRQDALNSPEQIPDKFGVLPEEPTDVQEEQSLAQAGTTGTLMIDGILFIDGAKSTTLSDSTNITQLRRLYFACGRDLKRVEEVLAEANFTILFNKMSYGSITLGGYPPGTLDKVRQVTKQPYLQSYDFYPAYDFTITYQESFVAKDSPPKWVQGNGLKYLDVRAAITPSTPRYDLIVDVFHFGSSPRNDQYVIDKCTTYEFDAARQSAVLAGESLKDISPTTIETNITLARDVARLAVQQLTFLYKRLHTPPSPLIDYISRRPSSTLTKEQKIKIVAETNRLLDIAINAHKNIFASYGFRVNVMEQTDILQKLRVSLKDDKIIELLEQRFDVQGFWFEADEDAILNNVRDTVSTTVGSTSASNKYVNSFDQDTYERKNLLKMASYLESAKQLANSLTAVAKGAKGRNFESLVTKTREYILMYIGIDPFALPAIPTISTGIPSFTSPGPIIAERLDPTRLPSWKKNKDDIANNTLDRLLSLYPAKIAKPLSKMINFLADLLEKSIAGLQLLVDKAKNFILPFKKKLDAFMAKYLSITGGGSFSNSLLKCAINLDLSLALPVLDTLLDFMDYFAQKVINALAAIGAWVADMITKLMCLPVDLINSFMGKINDLSFPIPCQVNRFTLGTEVDASLDRLKKVAATKQVALSSFSLDLLRYRVSVSSAPERVKQFKSGGVCASSQSNTFFKVSMLNLGA